MGSKVSPDLSDRLFGRAIADGDCLIWQGGTSGAAKYGHIRVNGKMQKCHRLSYQLHKGDIPGDMVVMHSCDRPACINPEHLSLGTQKDNMKDMRSKKREHDNKGERNGHSSLAAEDAREIRDTYRRYSRTHGSKVLAKKYGVSDQAILDVISWKTWSA